jgi:hypothetical protein
MDFIDHTHRESVERIEALRETFIALRREAWRWNPAPCPPKPAPVRRLTTPKLQRRMRYRERST